jgi:hypothetical protein
MRQKIKIYRMSLAKTFPATHPRKGEKTNFKESILNSLKINAGCKDCSKDRNGVSCFYCNRSANRKCHTCRANFPLWKKRIDEVIAGRAVLVFYEWNSKPYSKDRTRNLFIFGTSAVEDFIYDLEGDKKYMDAIPVIDSGLGCRN